MSNAVFPTFPGAKIEVTRTPEFATEILTARSKREQRVSWAGTPVYTFKLSIEFLRQGTVAGVAYQEAKTLADFYLARLGAFDSFLYVDPLDGTTRRVRFQEDKLDMARFMNNLWEAKTVTLREDKP